MVLDDLIAAGLTFALVVVASPIIMAVLTVSELLSVPGHDYKVNR